MLRSVLPSKKSVQKAGSRKTELWYITKADVRHLWGYYIPGPGSRPATIRVSTLQVMSG